MKNNDVLLLTLVAALLASPVLAQSVKVGPKGTKVKAAGVEVETGAHGTKVKTDGTKVEVGGHGTPVETDGQAAAKPRRKLPKRGAVICKGSQDVVVKNKTILAPVGVEVRGACTIVLEGCDVVATKVGARVTGSGDLKLVDTTVTAPVAIVVSGAGDVVLDRSHVHGRKAAVQITGAGDVSAQGSTIRGRMSLTGAGEFDDQGGNTLAK